MGETSPEFLTIMADNTTLNTGTGGDVIATDDISGVKFQRVKLVLGADGVNDGDVASGNPIPVSGTFWQATQPVSGTVTANAGTGTFTVSGTVTANAGTGTMSVDTELPTAAALADGASNPTTPTTGAANLGFNGTTWDRIRSEATNTDGEATSATGAMSTCSHETIFNGTTWDRMRAASALDGSGPTSHTGVLAVLQPGKRFDPSNLGTAVSSTSSVDVNGANSITLGVETTTTGTFTVEGTSDGVNWGTVEVFDGSADVWVSGQNITPTLGKTYQILAGGYRSIRIRTVTTLGATMAHTFNATMSQAFLGGIDTGPAPHNFGYNLVHKDAEYTTAQTGTALWTPTTGKKFVVTDITITAGGTTAGIVTLWQGASADTTYTAGTDPAIFRGEFAPSTTSRPGIAKSFNMPYVSTTVDHILRVTTSAAINPIYIQVNGYEI